MLNPLDPVTSVAEIEVCGTSRETTTVRIAGGANVVATSLDASTTDFCVTVPLRLNTQNTLVATAIDDLAAAPRPVASAEPVVVVNVDPSTIVIATVESRPLDEQEIADLVQQGIIDLNDAQNFNVSIFTVVFTIGAFPVAISQPVVIVPGEPVAIASTGGGWSPGAPVGFTGGDCASSCTTLVVVTPPVVDPVTEQPVVIPGVLILEGRIKTLKEFFQITLALLNTSTLFDLVDLNATIDLPAGLTLFASGPGTDVSAVNAEGAVETIAIDPIGPGETGTGQFVARGDTIGPKTVTVSFDGLIIGGGVLAETPPFDPIQFFSGQANTQLQVFGPPELGVVLAHPQQAGSFDVSLGEIFDLIVEITNLSSRPALYSSLDLFVGGRMELVDENNVAIPERSETRTFGTIPPGQTASTTFRIRSLLQGDIIACQGIASENITLSVDAGSLGQPCEIANTVPANFQPLPADRPPTLVGIQPLNGASEVLVTSSVFSVFTPQTACIVEDTFDNVVTETHRPVEPALGRSGHIGRSPDAGHLLPRGTGHIR